jgi:hypothetical protein
MWARLKVSTWSGDGQQAGPKVAAILSVVESCRRLQVPVRDYFHGSPRACRSPDPVPSRPYSRCVGARHS